MSIKNAVLGSCRSILAPLTRILIRFGISAGELNALVEQEYVKSAVRQLAAQDQLVSSSRISIITGLPRNIVASIVESMDEESPRRVGSLIQRAQRVLSGWFEDWDFRSPDGDPLVLELSGSGKTFETLVERYAGGGIRASGVIKELLGTGAVRMTREGRARAIRKTAAAGGADPETVQQLGEYTGALLRSFEHNLTSGPLEQLAIRGVRRTAGAPMVPLVRAQMAKRADAYIEATEAFLENRVRADSSGAENSEGAEEMIVGSFAFSAIYPTMEPTPRWQRGLAERLKRAAAHPVVE